MALKGAANKVLESTRALVDSKETETSFEEKMESLKQSVRVITVVDIRPQIRYLFFKAIRATRVYRLSPFSHCVSYVDARVENRRF